MQLHGVMTTKTQFKFLPPPRPKSQLYEMYGKATLQRASAHESARYHNPEDQIQIFTDVKTSNLILILPS